MQKYILLPIWVVLKSQKTDIIVVCKSETSVKTGREQSVRKVVIDMQNYLFSDAIAKVLKSYDSDFLLRCQTHRIKQQNYAESFSRIF